MQARSPPRKTASRAATSRDFSAAGAGSRRNGRVGDSEIAAQPIRKRLRLFARGQLADAHDVHELVGFLAPRDLGGIARLAYLVAHRARRVFVVDGGQLHAEAPAAPKPALARLDVGFLRPLG